MIRNPGDIDCTSETTPAFDNCFFISNVDNGWYASGLIVVREAMPELARLVDSLIAPMNFGIFYDGRAETHCNTNPAIAGNQPTGQMYGGYYVGLPPDSGDNWTHYYHNGALYSDPRISAYIGMGMHQMPGNVWWRSWRELPPPAPFPDCQSTDPDFSWQGQWPMGGFWQTYADPQSGQQFPVWEGHYTYPGSGLTFIPTYSGGMFEGLMPNEVVPETSWGTAQLRPGRRAHRRRSRSSTPPSSSTTRSGGCRRRARPTTPADTEATGSRAWPSPTTAPGPTPAIPTRGCPSATAARPRMSSPRTPRSSHWMSRRSRPTPISRRCARSIPACTGPTASSTPSTRRPERSATVTSCSTSR